MKEHDLKTDPIVFQDSLEGRKNFEIRINDRNFEAGDVLNLLETEFDGEEMKEGKPLVYTGRSLIRFVEYVLHGHSASCGLDDSWVIMSIVPIQDMP